MMASFTIPYRTPYTVIRYEIEDDCQLTIVYASGTRRTIILCENALYSKYQRTIVSDKHQSRRKHLHRTQNQEFVTDINIH